jgi:hypothetical protein
MSVSLLVHVCHSRDAHQREQNDSAREGPSAIRDRWGVAFGVFDHQFLMRVVEKRSVNILTSSVSMSYGAAREHPRPDSVKKARYRQPFKVIACLKW